MSNAGALTIYDGDQFAVMQHDVTALPEIFRANLGPEAEINEFDLDRISIPGGGALAWSIPDINGEPEAITEIEGVIILHGDRRAFWSVDFDESGGGTPPDCSSLDARIGTGWIGGESQEDRQAAEEVPSRACKTCPKAQWGSANEDPEDNTQACSQRKLVYMLRKDDFLPLVIDLAPTSVKAFSKFMLRLTSKAVPCTGALVGLKLAQDTSKAGIKYSVVAPRLIAKLPEDQAEIMSKVADTLRPYFAKTGITEQSQI